MSETLLFSYPLTRKFESLFSLGSGLFGIGTIYLTTRNVEGPVGFQWQLFFLYTFFLISMIIGEILWIRTYRREPLEFRILGNELEVKWFRTTKRYPIEAVHIEGTGLRVKGSVYRATKIAVGPDVFHIFRNLTDCEKLLEYFSESELSHEKPHPGDAEALREPKMTKNDPEKES